MLSLWEEIAQLADFDKVPDYVGFPFPFIITNRLLHALLIAVFDTIDFFESIQQYKN